MILKEARLLALSIFLFMLVLGQAALHPGAAVSSFDNPGIEGSALLIASAQSTDSSRPLYGHAWASNIGWISFNSGDCDRDRNGWIDTGNCGGTNNSSGSASKPYQAVLYSDNLIRGHAWNQNIGYIRLDPDDAVTDAPTESGNSQVSTRITGSGTNQTVIGWARACVVYVANCAGALKPNSERGGWDGWISMKGANYGVIFNGSTFSNYAWGSNVVGWVSFSGTNPTYQVIVEPRPDHCLNGVQDSAQGETGIDVGGPCGGGTGTCSDGILNGGETSIDLGGRCGTCTDNILNGNETSVDGGGRCGTCTDDVQNANETGPDTGGRCAANAVCDNGVRDQGNGEIDVDFGGACGLGLGTCSDTEQNANETGLNTGGRCAVGGGYAAQADRPMNVTFITPRSETSTETEFSIDPSGSFTGVVNISLADNKLKNSSGTELADLTAIFRSGVSTIAPPYDSRVGFRVRVSPISGLFPSGNYTVNVSVDDGTGSKIVPLVLRVNNLSGGTIREF